MTTEELILYYQNLLIVQYFGLPKASGTIGILVKELIADQIIDKVQNAYDLNTAIGVQLDVLAEYRGAKRDLYGLDLNRQYFEMPDYSDIKADLAHGFGEYGEDPTLWFFLTYQDANRPTYRLNDDELRRLIKFKAKVQSSKQTIKDIDNILMEFFGNKVAMFDGQNMTMTYIDLISDTDTLFSIVNQTKSFPSPAGVLVTAIKSETFTEFFGFQNYDSPIDPVFVGFSEYENDTNGSFIQYG